MAAAHHRLHGALKGWVPMQHVDYDLLFGYDGRTGHFTTYTGRYNVGDLLPITDEECWVVTAVEPGRQDSGRERLHLQRYLGQSGF